MNLFLRRPVLTGTIWILQIFVPVVTAINYFHIEPVMVKEVIWDASCVCDCLK